MAEPFFQFKTIFGSQGAIDPYLTRAIIGRLRLHWFHRGDNDPDPHTHPFGFWTFPLTSYVEDVYHPTDFRAPWHSLGCRRRVVRAFRLHYRDPSFVHRVVGRWSGARFPTRVGPTRDLPYTKPGSMFSIVWTFGYKGSWGFWTKAGFIPWKHYLKCVR